MEGMLVLKLVNRMVAAGLLKSLTLSVCLCVANPCQQEMSDTQHKHYSTEIFPVLKAGEGRCCSFQLRENELACFT